MMDVEFGTVTQEFRSLVDRRRELITFLGTVFAGMGLFLQNTLQGNLPAALDPIAQNVFTFYAVLVMVPALILALRFARLHGGLMLNGVLFARFLQDQNFTRKPDIPRAGRYNLLGVSFLQFALVNFVASFSAAMLVISGTDNTRWAVAVGTGLFVAWFGYFFRTHRQGVQFARNMVATRTFGPCIHEEWRDHVSKSLKDANKTLNWNVGFVALMTFSVFEVVTSIGQLKERDAIAAHLKQIGPLAYLTLLTVVALVGLITFLRVRVAVGTFSLLLDPTDRPFRVGRVTDSLLAYALLAFLLAVAVHLLLVVGGPGLKPLIRLAIDLGVVLLAILAEQLTLAIAGHRLNRHSLALISQQFATPAPDIDIQSR